MSVTVSSVQVEFHLNPPKVTYLQGCDMAIPALQDAFRAIEESEEGRSQPTSKIISASGNEPFSQDGSVTNALTVTVLPPYVQAFEAGAIPFQTSNGNLLGTFVESPGAIVQINNAVGSLNVSSGEIEYASFGGGVTYDAINGYSLSEGIDGKLGDGRIIGTPRAPVDNFTDGLAISHSRGLNTFYVIGDAIVDSGLDYTDHVFQGQGLNLTTLDISDAASVNNCAFLFAKIKGTLDGDSRLEDSMIDGLVYVNGVIERCLLTTEVITLAGNKAAHIVNCQSAVEGPDASPIIDMGGTGQGLTLSNYNGGLRLRNKTGPDKVSLNLNSATVMLENTVTNGSFVIRGDGKLVDELGNRITTGTWNGGVTIDNQTSAEEAKQVLLSTEAFP